MKDIREIYENIFIVTLLFMCYNAYDMLKNIRLFLALYAIALIYAFFQNDFVMAFLNAIGLMSIFMVVLTMYLFLERFGYFDVFGYTFKKTYYAFSRKQESLDDDLKEKYSSFYNYVQKANQSRILVRLDFLGLSVLFIALNFALSYLYVFLQ